MRFAALTLIGSLTLAALPAANAAPVIPAVPARASANLVAVAWGCGPAFHPNAWGYCVPNYYGYPVWGAYYGHYRPYWHPWHHWGHWHR